MSLAALRSASWRENEIDEVLDRRAIEAEFVPVVRLDTLTVVGFEAVARGPAGSSVDTHVSLVEAAVAVGREAELDWICRAAAYRAALDARLHPSLTVFVKTDPRSLAAPCPPDLAPAVWRAESKLRVVIEVSDRMLAASPDSVPAAVARARRVGWGVALDNVGAEPHTLALLPIVEPDVVKIDLGQLEQRGERSLALVMNAVLAEVELSGATVLTTGIATKAQLALARALGAEVGQGPLLGAAGPLPDGVAPANRPVRLISAASRNGLTPFDVISGEVDPKTAPRSTLDMLSRQLEHGASSASGPAFVVGIYQDVRHLDAGALERLAALADRGCVVTVLAPGMPAAPAPGIHGQHLAADERIRGEWDVLVVADHFAAALVSRTLGASDGRSEFCLTYDRSLVLDAARTVFDRPEVADLAALGDS